MTTQLAGWLTGLGLVAIAVGFYLLQRLRVRQRTVVVETTLFWRHALEATKARVLVQRFRHPWVYALLLAIATSLWLSFAQLSTTGDPDHRTLVLIDGSAAMARGDRFATTLELVHDLVASLPVDTRTVVLCGGAARTVLGPGEHSRLLRERLRLAAPQACPSIIEAVIHTHLAPHRAGQLRVIVAGDAIVDAAFADQLPADVSLERLAPAATAMRNTGITALGVAPAKSGAWQKVDLLVEVRTTAGEPVAPTLRLAGQSLDVAPVAQNAGTVSRLTYHDIPARGELLQVTVAGTSAGTDANPLDDAASFVLPDRRRRRVAIEPDLPAMLTNVVIADPAMIVATDAGSADVVLRRGGSSFGAGIPAIEFVDERDQESAFLVQCRRDEDPSEIVFQLHDRLGLAEIDTTDVARRMGKVIAMAAVRGERRGLRLWRSLLAPEFNFVQSRSFPLFIALALRWASDAWEPPLTLPAGVVSDLAGVRLEDANGRHVSSLGDGFTPTTASVFTTDRGQRLAAALLDPNVTAPITPGAQLTNAEAPSFGLDLSTTLLLLALGLILCEWVLFQRGRLP